MKGQHSITSTLSSLPGTVTIGTGIIGLISSLALATPYPEAGNFQQGAKIWAENCGRCHNIRDPQDMRNDQWITSVFHMRVRAGLTGQETRDVLTFLQASNTPASTLPASKPAQETVVTTPPAAVSAPATNKVSKNTAKKAPATPSRSAKVKSVKSTRIAVAPTPKTVAIKTMPKAPKKQVSTAAPKKAQTSKTVVATSASSTSTTKGKSGKTIYQQTCIACHGSNGTGMLPGVPDLTKKSGRLAKSDSTLIKNITQGYQSPGSPMAMPPRGGNPDLTEADIKAVLSYIRKTFTK